MAIHNKANFPKRESLKSKKLIDQLFTEGASIYTPPIRVLYLPCDTLPVHQVLFSVAKKKHKLAVTRNKLKRMMREAYRLNKHILASQAEKHFLIACIYIGRSPSISFQEIQKQIIASLQHITNCNPPTS